MLEENTFNYKLEPIQLIDEVSSTEYYIGDSENTSNPTKNSWRIKKIIKIGNVWNFLYPDGNQTFEYVWNDRYTYTYPV